MAENYREVNFHGLVGSTHNYGGLAKGNIASEENAGLVSHPRAAFLQGLEHALLGVKLGLCEAVLPPHPRPYIPALREYRYEGSDEQIIEKVFKDDPNLLAKMSSSSFMWSANAATVAPSCDVIDGRLQMTIASMMANEHRMIEMGQTQAILKAIFGDVATIHRGIEFGIDVGDEGAANHMRFAASHGEHGVHLFVYGRDMFRAPILTEKYMPRQSRESSSFVVQNHKLLQEPIFAQQHPDAIDAGVFHNDVISTNNGPVWLVHEKAYGDTWKVVDEVQRRIDGDLLVFPALEGCLPLEDAVSSYVFNSRIVTLPDETMAIIAPIESTENDAARAYLESIVAFPMTPINEIHYVDLGQSMRNGGGPACLRLRVVMSEEERTGMKGNVILTDEIYHALRCWSEKHYREELHPKDLADPQLLRENHEGLDELTQILELGSIYYFQK